MTQPTSLQISTDYNAALLWLMGDLKQARLSEVMAAFHERLGTLIPPEHYQTNKSGDAKWDNYVRWARQALVSIGLMGSEGWGLWTITPEGETWLREHPDGGREPLMRRLREHRAERASAKTSTPPSKTHTVTLNGQTFTLTAADVLTQIRKALAEGVPQEARRFKAWHIVVDGEALSVKWVIAQVTGLSPAQFQSQQARQILSALGLEPQSDQETPPVPPTSPAPAELSREAFFAAVLKALQERLPSGVQVSDCPAEWNYRELTAPVSRTRYALRLGYDYAEIGLHLQGQEERNLRLLDQLRLHLDAITAQFHEPVRAEPWRQHWARVYVMRALPSLTPETAQAYAEDWLRFITVTLPFLEEAANNLGMRRKVHRPPPNDKPADQGRAVEILYRRIGVIRDYLKGNPIAAPSDEALCDWVRFCYDFELFAEGAQLFGLIRPNEVHAWLYERTKKFARICELRVRDQHDHS